MRFLILFLFILSTSLIQAQEVLLESKIKTSIENVPAQVGVAIIINGKDTITINNECHYPLMSVMKYPQALAVLHKDSAKLSPFNICFTLYSIAYPSFCSYLAVIVPSSSIVLSKSSRFSANITFNSCIL